MVKFMGGVFVQNYKHNSERLSDHDSGECFLVIHAIFLRESHRHKSRFEFDNFAGLVPLVVEDPLSAKNRFSGGHRRFWHQFPCFGLLVAIEFDLTDVKKRRYIVKIHFFFDPPSSDK